MKEVFEQKHEFKIDSISLDEWESYRDLRLDALASDPQAFATPLEKYSNLDENGWKEKIKKCLSKNNAMFIANSPDGPIGMMGYYPEGNDTVNIYGVYVKKDFRGQGVSGKIMKSILNSLDNNEEIKTIKLIVNKNQIAAINFYKRYGFKEVEEIKGVQMGNGEICDELSMEKEIK